MNKLKIIIIVLSLLVISNLVVFFVNKTNVNDRIELILDDNLEKLDIHHKLLLSHQSKLADSFYKTTLDKNSFLFLYEKALNSNGQQRDISREKLKKLLNKNYQIMNNAGVLQYQFVFPNNLSFLRMHDTSKYGDNLSDIRPDFKFTNETKKISRGLVQGRIIHGFRNIYPIFSVTGKHLGAVEISFSSDSFQDALTKISGIHAHFLINKDVFRIEDFNNNMYKNNYTQSSENINYMMSLTKTHNRKVCIIDNTKKLAHLQDEIFYKMNKGEKFSFYTRAGAKDIEVIAFLPIKRFNSNDTVAWLVSYTKNQFIYETFRTGQLITIFSFLILSLLAFFIYQQTIAEMRIKKEHTLLDDVINTSEDMIFVTNFNTVSFFNKKFKIYMDLTYMDKIQDITSKFMDMPGYLYKGLLKPNEVFNELILRTSEEDRIVCLLDKQMNPKAFTISIAPSSYTKGDYLVTLTDITKIKEKELKISNKAFYDGLTGVYNRNKFDELIDIELKRDKRYKSTFSIAIVDIDHFKNFNDTHGHLIGDEVLIMLATYLNNNVRNTDVFARWGGEEFVILFPETTDENAQIVCEKLRVGITQLEHKIAGSITCSFGVTQYQENDVLASLFKRCDDALYEAKETGRNKVLIRK